MQVGLRRRLLEDAQGFGRQVAGNARPAAPRADAPTAGALLGLEGPAIGLPDRVGGVAHVRAVA